MGGFAGPDTEDTTIGQGELKTAQSSPGGAYASHPNWPASEITDVPLAQVEVWGNADVLPQGQPAFKGPDWWPF